jgi:adenylyltransferase/sulfurtransferase
MHSEILSERELRRFKPQTDLKGIGLEGQETIKKAKILVVGAGGKGTAAMKALISAGVGYLGVSDDTLVQEDTLSRQSLYNDNDIGKQKAIVSKQYLRARNGLTEIKVHNIRLTAENLNKIISAYNLIIDATNDFESHVPIREAAKMGGKALIFGHINNNKLYISTILPGNEKPLHEIIPPQDKLDAEDEDQDTAVIIINSLAGTMLANEAIKTVLNKPSQLKDNLLIIKLSDYSFALQPY